MINFNSHPEKYQHWSLEIKGQLATLKMNVNEEGGLYPGYKLKLNSYFAGDWRDHMETAIEKGHGIASFPPFFGTSDYASQFKFINSNISKCTRIF